MPRPQLSDDELLQMRRRMARAGLDMVRKQGEDKVSFRSLAAALDISHTLPYRYFENKEALLAAIRCESLRAFDQHIRPRIDPATAYSRLESLFIAYIDFARSYPADYQLLFSGNQPPPNTYPDLLAARRDFFDFSLDIVQACIDEGLITGEAREVAHAYWVSLHGMMTLHAANQLVHGKTLEQLAPSMLQRLMGTVSKPRIRKKPTGKGSLETRSSVRRKGAQA